MIEFISIIIAGIALFISILSYLRTVKLNKPFLQLKMQISKGMYFESMGGYHYTLSIINSGERTVELVHPISIIFYNKNSKRIGEKENIVDYEIKDSNLPIEISKDNVINIGFNDSVILKHLKRESGTFFFKIIIRNSRYEFYYSKRMKFTIENDKIIIPENT